MEKRVIIAAILSVILILGWGYFMPHTKHAGVAVKKTEHVRNILSSASTVGAHKGSTVMKHTASEPEEHIVVSKSIQSVKNVFYKGRKIYVSFNVPDGAVSKINLLNYSYTEKNFKDKINLANAKHINRIINFVPQNSKLAIKLINVEKKKDSVKFIYTLGSSIILTKDYTFLKGKYVLTNSVSIKNLTNKPIEFKGHYILSAALKPVLKKSNHIKFSPIVYIKNGSVTPDITRTTHYSGNISFVGFNSKYFMFSAISPGSIISVKKIGPAVSFIIPKEILVSPKKTAYISLKIYGGPKKLSLLDPLGHHLSSTIGFGFFGFFSIILLHILEFFYGFVHNYGFAIILMVLAIRIVFYPLTYIGFKSMKQMHKLTPKINDLREKYKNNKTELNKKIMEIYKENKVNPFGGCLPMILQIPVFYGLYTTLLIAIQLRNAPFMLWINNLAVQDPYYILPIIMGITMFISQKMNPTMGDPTQAKIMLILPIAFTFLFIHFPAGLLLYWTVNNILTIAQQYSINRKFA